MRGWICFNLTREGIPLYDYPLHEPISTGLSYSPEFLALKAYIHAGATVSEVKELYENGHLDSPFTKFLINFYLADMSYSNHVSDAVELERLRRSESNT